VQGIFCRPVQTGNTSLDTLLPLISGGTSLSVSTFCSGVFIFSGGELGSVSHFSSAYALAR
jgi:hypothetical protein